MVHFTLHTENMPQLCHFIRANVIEYSSGAAEEILDSYIPNKSDAKRKEKLDNKKGNTEHNAPNSTENELENFV